MKTKSELIEKAMKAAVKAANGERVLLTVGTTVYSNKAFKEDATPKQETWRERNLRRQAEGVRFQCVNPIAPQGEEWWFPPRKQHFLLQEKDYREYVPEPLPHAELRARYEKKLAAGEEVVVQVAREGAWVDLGPKGKVSWLPGNIYRIKPETKTIWFGLFRDRDNVVRFCTDADQRSEKDLIEQLAKEGFTPVGSIESREVGIKP